MYKKFSVVFVLMTLTGCAGMNSDFEHGTPAKDSGYWLQQADDMTNPKLMNQTHSNFTGANIDVRQYRLINTGGLRLPLKQLNLLINPNFSEDRKETSEPMNITYGGAAPIISTVNCDAKYCYPEPNSPFRQEDSVSRVWLSPYVSPDDSVHLGEVVYFVTKKSKWIGVE